MLNDEIRERKGLLKKKKIEYTGQIRNMGYEIEITP
jgi:hypothetical protein